jgi:predicted enzyme related to lactoylglutathione lyase
MKGSVMKRVTGLGGVFFKCRDRAATMAWYAKHLGLPVEEYGAWLFQWREAGEPERKGMTVFSFFAQDTDYFAPSERDVMFNFRVDDLDAVLTALRAEGVQVDDKVEEYPYGRFGWIMDPDGRRVELWEPNAAAERGEESDTGGQ